MRKKFFCFLVIFFVQLNTAIAAINQKNSMPEILKYRNYNMQKLISGLDAKTKEKFINQLNQRQEELRQLERQYR